MRGETNRTLETRPDCPISIHSPHARGDTDCFISRDSCNISIHSPHARGDAAIGNPQPLIIYFNPLPSCEGRQADQSGGKRAAHFNPLPSCEWRQNERHIHHSGHYFNPLPSCEGRPKIINPSWYMLGFQSTPFMRGETTIDKLLPRHKPISIHSPHARGDAYQDGSDKTHQHFNPLPLCEGRPVLKANWLT